MTSGFRKKLPTDLPREIGEVDVAKSVSREVDFDRPFVSCDAEHRTVHGAAERVVPVEQPLHHPVCEPAARVVDDCAQDRVELAETHGVVLP